MLIAEKNRKSGLFRDRYVPSCTFHFSLLTPVAGVTQSKYAVKDSWHDYVVIFKRGPLG